MMEPGRPGARTATGPVAAGRSMRDHSTAQDLSG